MTGGGVSMARGFHSTQGYHHGSVSSYDRQHVQGTAQTADILAMVLVVVTHSLMSHNPDASRFYPQWCVALLLPLLLL